jgi:3-mercaptopyruvate sulfurtransferase SseA
MDRGFKRVRPLAGGLDAWIEAGYPVDQPPTFQATGTLPTI